MDKISKLKLSDLKSDKNNANKGTERGNHLLLDSLKKYGAGRSILIDKNGTIIAGNKTAASAKENGMENCIVLQTDGKQIIAVQRTDLDLEKDQEARALAYADNRIAQIDLEWDEKSILSDIESGIDLSGLWTQEEIEDIQELISDKSDLGDMDFGGKINNEDDISQIVIYCPDGMLPDVKGCVMELREKFPALVVRVKDGL